MTRTKKSNIAERVRRSIRDEAAYFVPEPADVVKLDANESPYQLSAELKNKWLESLGSIALNRYPDGPARALCETVREVWVVPDRYDIMIGNGSDELIQIVETALAGPGGVVMTPSPSFVVYENTAKLLGARYVGVPLRENFELDLDVFLAAIDEHNPDCIFLATPNNPTGNAFRDDDIDAIAAHAKGLVVVDEAYGVYQDEPSLARLDRFDNVVIMRTLSKIGFAGLRIGLLVGQAPWIQELHKVRPPYNINSLSQASAEFALTHAAQLQSQVEQVVAERERLNRELVTIAGLDVFPSDANFILVRTTGKRSATDVYQALLRDGVAVKNLDRADTPLSNCLRITVGSRPENDALIESLSAILKA